MTPAGSSAPGGLVAAYSFDEGSGTTVIDASGNGNNGTVTDGTWTNGVHGGALSFNGSSTIVTIPDSASLEVSNAVTLEAWVERTALSQSWSDVIYKGGTGGDNYYLEGSSTYAAAAPVGGAVIGGGHAEAAGPAQVQPATWTHLAMTYDGSVVRLYVNGAQVADAPASGAITTSNDALQIGGDSAFGQFFTGAIDDVRVYNAALTATEIQSDMNTPVGSSASSTFTLAPATAEVTTGQTQQFTATTPVSWSVDAVVGGNSTVGTITGSGLYTAPSAAGTHTITAAANGGQSATATVHVSDDAGTFTFHNDNMRTGANTHETVLTPANVRSATFGKLFSYSLDGLAFASPLYVKGVTIGGVQHNVVYVATEHDSVYAFDADGRSSTPLWKDSFIDSANGIDPLDPNATGESADIPNEIGITGTPVIDPATNAMYFVTADQRASGGTTTYENWLHAIDIRTGVEKANSPQLINPTVAGTGVDANGGMIPFNNQTENQRAALTLANGKLYVAFANHGFNPPYHGWLLQYDPTTLTTDWIFNTSPDAQSGGIWMGGDGVGVDSSGQLYFSTGNGTFDAGSGGRDYGDTVLKLNHGDGSVADYFTPYNFQDLDTHDIDLASGGILLLPDQPGAHPHEVIAAGKGGTIYVVDRDQMGGVGSTDDSQIVQSLVNAFPTCCSFNTGNYSAPVYFNGAAYYAPVSSPLMRFGLTNGLLTSTPTSESPETYLGRTATFSARGGAISVSANGTSSAGILWGLQSSGDSLPGTLHAYNPANVADEYYTSDEAGNRDQLNPWLKFTVPTVDNGRVYVVSARRLTAFGLLPGVATSSGSSGGGGGGGGGGGTGGGGTGGGGGGGGGGGVPPDLRVSLTASSTTAPAVGEPLNYSIAVTTGNVGSASDVRLTVALPAGYKVTSTYADRGPGCEGAAPTLTCDVAWISPGVATHVLVSGSVGQAGEQDATATVTSLVEPELNPADNTTTLKLAAPPSPTPAPTPVPPPILLVVKHAAALHGTARPGHTLRAVAPTWSMKPQRIRFSWQACVRNRCTTIPGAKAMTLRIRKAWIGKQIRFVAVGVVGQRSVISRSPTMLVRE